MGGWLSAPQRSTGGLPVRPVPFVLPPAIEVVAGENGPVVAQRAVAALEESLLTRGYALLDAPVDVGGIGEHLASLRRLGRVFFASPAELKARARDPAGANRWYVAQLASQFLKMRLSEPAHVWPSPELETAFSGVFRFADSLASHAVAALHARLNSPFLDSAALAELATCVRERSAVGMVHYDDPMAPATVAAREGALARREPVEFVEVADARYCVCKTHTDTGLLTVIFVNETPGLEIIDRRTKKFELVEQEAARTCPPGHVRCMVIMGQKAPLFLGDALRPTEHRVTVRAGVVRDSVLFFQDTVDSENRYPDPVVCEAARASDLLDQGGASATPL